MNGGNPGSGRWFRKKNLVSVFLALLAVLHLWQAWTQPLPASAATPPPQVQVTFIPDIQPLDIEQEESTGLNPGSTSIEPDISLPEPQTVSPGEPSFTPVPPEFGTEVMGYAYDCQDGLETIHLWVNGQATILDYNNPEARILIEKFRTYTDYYTDNSNEIKDLRYEVVKNGWTTGTLLAGFILSGGVAAASCAGMALGGATIPICAASLGLTLVDTALFGIQAVDTVKSNLDASRAFREQAELIEKAENIVSSLQTIILTREEELP